MRKQLTAVALFLQCLTALSQADSNHARYMFSFVTLDMGWGKNLNPASRLIESPFWATNGPTVNLSALFALKESYWGIAAQMGYSAPVFNIKTYSPITADTNNTNVYNGGNASHYNIYYALGGLGIKLPQRTTTNAIELRFMIGPLICTQPALTYSVKVTQGNTYEIYTTHTTSSTAVAIAISPGIGIGEKLTKHIAIMAYANILFAGMRFKTTNTTTSLGNTAAQTSAIAGSLMEYGNLTACISYSFGRMTPNITY